jgi:hypothetical protein
MIRMSDEEVSSFLDSQVYGVLGSAGLDGLPHMLYVGYLYVFGNGVTGVLAGFANVVGRTR